MNIKPYILAAGIGIASFCPTPVKADNLLDKVNSMLNSQGFPKRELRTEHYLYFADTPYHNAVYRKDGRVLIEQSPVVPQQFIDNSGTPLNYITNQAPVYCVTDEEQKDLECWIDEKTDGINGNERRMKARDEL